MSGAHHLYLGRNRAALVCSLSCGGFGLGWLADAVRIPRYVRELADAESRTASAAVAAAAAAPPAAGRAANPMAPDRMADLEAPREGETAQNYYDEKYVMREFVLPLLEVKDAGLFDANATYTGSAGVDPLA